MTDSMKFGPEWLRNLSTDSSSIALGNSSSSNTSAGSSSTVSSGGGTNNHATNANSNHGSSVNASTPRNMFPEFRYGREEMLSLFDKNCNMPEILPLYKKICVEKVQIPLALTPTTEDEIIQNSQVPTQRPLWIQRSPTGFSSSARGLSRGGSVERGRIRGKPMYSTFQRSPALFEEDGRPGLLKPERGWYERNGSGDTTVGNASSGGNSGIGSGSDWNGGGTPHTSPRREFSNHSRNMENWRRNRNDDGAGEPTTEGWRTSSSTHSFGGLPRWGRSTSWRDEDGPQSEIQGLSTNSSNMIQRSFSTISTALTSSNSMQKGLSGKLSIKTGTSSSGAPSNKSDQWSSENGGITRLQDGEDNLPEWATDIPLEGGGSFDATGAFLGSAGDEGGEIGGCLDHNQKEETEDSALNSSGVDDVLSPLNEQSNDNEHGSELDGTRHTELHIKVSRNTNANGMHISSKQSTDTLSSSMTNESAKSVPTTTDSVSTIQVPQSTPLTLPGQRRLSDHMIEAADDMVTKLINDDDISDIEKSANNAAFPSVSSANMKTVSNLEQTLLASQNISHVPNSNNSVGVAPGQKCVFLYGGLEQQQVQPQLQHQFHPSNIIHSDISSMGSHSGSELWYYRDPQSKVQGPFAALEMTEWYRAGYFNENLLVRRVCDTRFRALGELIKTCQNNMPFTHSSLLGTINMEPAPVHLKEQCDELKGNVTAAADTLSAAVKNLSSVDMLHMLNVHFQMLQEQYIRRQEMTILSDLAKNEAFHRLSPAEREAVVRQKAQIMGLPEYLTSLTNLGNSLLTLNPSAGTQLFNAILECSKKDSQQPVYPQANPLSSNYMDVGEFILSMQRQQQPRHHQPHQQQQNHHQQQQLPLQAQAQFSGFDGNIRPDNLVGNGMLEDLNIRMLLSGNNALPPQPLIQHHAAKVAPQELISNSHGGGYLTEQQILASSAAAAANASQSPLLQMWLPSASANILGDPPTPQVHTPQLSQRSQNQWASSGPLVGIPNVMGTEGSQNEQLDVAPSSSPTSMWVNAKLAQNKDLDSNEIKMHSEEQKRLLNEEMSHFESKNDSVTTTPSVINSQFHVPEENLQQPYSKSNRNEENNQGLEKQVPQGLNKKQKTSTVSTTVANQKLKEEFKKVDSEEKRRQKEERKRQQMEEEKRRLQQVEQERRRQLQEEEDRQKQIQAQRRKALLGSGNGLSTTQKSSKEQKVQSSSVAPWSSQSITMSTTSSPCLAEIQKAERRERRADQQRQLELLEKQVRLNTVTALEAIDAVPKWNASPVQAKSIAEIQAEEAKKLNAEALCEAQRRKEIEMQAALNMASVNNSAGNLSCPTSTWNNVAQNNKFWGSSTSNNNIASGFWEDPTKHKTGTSGSSVGSFASAISTGKQPSPQKPAQSTASAVSSRNLKKSQTVSVMQSTTSAAAPKNSKGGIINQPPQGSSAPQPGSKQANNNKSTYVDKKGAAIPKNNNGSSGGNPSSSKDEFENEFINWCMKSLSNMNTKVDVPTFVTFLRDLESPYEVKDYIRIYLGESKEFNDFAKQFLERRSKYKNLQRAQNAHNDDMCKPAPAITPSAGNDNSDGKNKQKKIKKNKMTKLDARILGFSVTAAEGRINVGDRDYVDAP